MSGNSSSEELSRIKVFEMYLEGAKWLLAIAAGMLVYGLDRLTEHPVEGWPLRLFAVSSAFLGVSAAAALYYLQKSFAYASSGAEIAAARTQERAAANVHAPSDENAPMRNEAAAKAAEKDKERRDKLHGRIGSAFWLMNWSFAIGGLLYLLFGLQQILTIKSEPRTQFETSEQGVFVTRGSQTWVLQTGKNGPVWVRLPDAPKH